MAGTHAHDEEGARLVAEARAAHAEAEAARQRLRDQLALTDAVVASVDELLSSVAHDLKTPLTAIRGHAQLAARRLARFATPDTTGVADQLAKIDDSTQRMLTLIDELVDTTRARMAEMLDLRAQATDLVALVREVVERYQGITAHQFDIEAAQPLEATVDPARMRQVVENILSTAVTYSPVGGAISIRITREDGMQGPEAVIVMRDHGAVIPVSALPSIFARVPRAHVSAQAEGGRAPSAPSLRNARRIVEQHGGTIGVESQEGEGSTFTIRLPL